MYIAARPKTAKIYKVYGLVRACVCVCALVFMFQEAVSKK